jgi:RNA polymerase sigma factor (sigma-70 family)
MSEVRTDDELLREYTEQGSERAFRTLVEKHLDLVFATTFRGVHDLGAAQEIAQNVFIALARKALWLQGERSVAAWLHKTALLEVRSWWRAELRRRRREQTAIELGTTMRDNDSLLKALTGELDDALLKLRKSDREALMLRYFEGRSHREIGALLGAREDAVRMRIEKALERLTQFFRRRGYAVPAVATTASVLSGAAKAAPVGLIHAVAKSALTVGGAGALTGLKLLAGRLVGLTNSQTLALCVALTAAPIAGGWLAKQNAVGGLAHARANLEAVGEQRDLSSADLIRLRAESSRLDASLLEALKAQARYDEGARKLQAWNARARDLLNNSDYHWPEDLPYVRVRKSVVKSLDLLNHPPTAFSQSGTMTAPALELFGITPQEQAPTEQALASYWRGVRDLSLANAYETNLPGAPTGRLTKTVTVPPLGLPLRDLADNTRTELVNLLGAEREKLLFDGWDQGAIQIFWPGNLWKIADEPQTLEVWFDPVATNGAPRYGSSWSINSGGATSTAGKGSLRVLPRDIANRFFAPWLQRFGLTPNDFMGASND